MATFAQIQKQIAQLQAEAEKVRQSEIEAVVSRIREAIATYGLTASDLGLSTARAFPGRRKGAAKGIGIPKYRDPATGKTWTGRGKPPLWLAGAKDRSAYLIEGAAPAGPVADASSESAGTSKSAGRKPRASRKQ